jgi:uncharacterized protein
MTEAEKRKIATTFIEGLRRQDANLLSGIMTPDVIWSIPGSAIVSGEARGVKSIIERATHFAEFSLKIDILYVVVGFSGVALLLHNTGTHNGKSLDEHLTTVIQLDGAKIKRLDTYISDIPMLNEYFA